MSGIIAGRTKWEARVGLTESPIEQAFLDALCNMAVSPEHGYKIGKHPNSSQTIAIKPQQWVGRYRVDFSIVFRFFGSELAIVAEMDGHEFHEKTKTQAARDKTRDRYLTKIGYQVLRFTGSEVFLDANRCAAEVLERIMDFQSACIVAAAEHSNIEQTEAA